MKASVESSAMIFFAEAMWRRATSSSARAVWGWGATLRIFVFVRSCWTSASVIGALDERDQGLLLDRSDEPRRVRLPFLLRENRRIDLESDLLACLAAEARELASVRPPEDQKIDVAGRLAPVARVSTRPRPVDERGLDAVESLQLLLQDRHRPEGLEDEARELK